MKKMLVATSVALISMGFAGSASVTALAAPAEQGAGQPAPQLKMLFRSDRLLGQIVRGAENENLGEVSQILLDPESGQPVYVIVTSGGAFDIAEEKRLVPWEALRIDPETYAVSMGLTEHQFKQAPQGTVISTRRQAEEIDRAYGVKGP